MSSDRSSTSVQERLGHTRFTRVEYVNHASVEIDPKDGKPLSHYIKKNKKVKAFPIKTRGIAFANLRAIETNPTIDPPPRVCYNCWQKGHSQNKCPRPTKGVFCFNCGRRNRTVETCPRCKDAYETYEEKLKGKKPYKMNEHQMEDEEEDQEALLRRLIEQDDRARALVQKERKLDVYEESLREAQERGSRRLPRDVSPPPRSSHLSRYDRYERENTRYNSREDVGNSSYRDRSPRVRFDNDDDNERNHRNGRSSPWRREHSRHSLESRERRSSYDRHSRESRLDHRDYGSYKTSITDKGSRESERRSMLRDYFDEDRHSSERRVSESPARVPSTSSDDPVHEVLELARSISHLSAETQELIMKQVMAERRQKARLRDMKVQEDDAWA